MSLLLDSHGLIWFLENSPKLSPAAAAVLDDPLPQWFLSAISVAEAALVIQKRRLGIREVDLFDAIEMSGRIDVVPISYDVVRSSLRLTQLDDIHDRIIVATAQMLAADRPSLRLVSGDAKIISSNLVPTIW